MALEVIISHFGFGILLFFIINWIGRHSYSIGYMQISLFVRVEEAPAFNFLIRVLTPIVYIIILSAVLYYFGLDHFVTNIYLVNVSYIIFRLFFNLATGRGKLLNWYRQFLYWSAIVVISYYTYEKIIKTKSNILPDFTTVANELWIIILIFLFQITNNLRFSQDSTIQRKDDFLKDKYYRFRQLYGNLIKEITQNELLEAIVYSILIYEDFNRPKIARFVENMKFNITKKPHTLGVMQFYTKKMISDRESVELGTQKICSKYLSLLEEFRKNPQRFYGDWQLVDEIINDYNGGSSYHSEVSELFTKIRTSFYNGTSDTLLQQ